MDLVDNNGQPPIKNNDTIDSPQNTDSTLHHGATGAPDSVHIAQAAGGTTPKTPLFESDRHSQMKKFAFFVLVFFAAVILGVLCKVLSTILVPVVVAILLSSVFYPLVNALNTKLHIPWTLGIFIVLLIVLAVVVVLATVITASVTTFAKQYSQYERVFMAIYKAVADKFDLQYNGDKNFLENVWGFGRVRSLVQSIAMSLSGSLVAIVKNLVLVLLYIAFFLIEIKSSPKKINAIFIGKNSTRFSAIVTQVTGNIKTFLSTKFLISVATGVLVFLVCLGVGVNFAILWAFVAFVMNFIPTFGSIFSVLITAVFSFLQFYPSAPPIVFVSVSLVVINMVLGNIVEPRIEGDNLDLSPFVILVSLAFWGFMWGFIGMIIAVPLMVIVKIVCDSPLFPFLRPVAIVIGNSKKQHKASK